jgi:hypothetical protein
VNARDAWLPIRGFMAPFRPKHYLSFDSGFRPYGHWSQVGHSEGPTNHLLVKKTWVRDCEGCWSCQVV